MEENVIQHKAFSEGLNAFWDYIKAVQAKELPYVGQKVIQLIDNFGPTLREHLTDEINTLLALNQYNIDWKTVNKAIITHAIKTADKVHRERDISVKRLLTVYSGKTNPFYDVQ